MESFEREDGDMEDWIREEFGDVDAPILQEKLRNLKDSLEIVPSIVIQPNGAGSYKMARVSEGAEMTDQTATNFLIGAMLEMLSKSLRVRSFAKIAGQLYTVEDDIIERLN